ncbi:DNA polymerase IV [Symbiobacterium terraclitae]|uniref:DNA polymerase IV n=1 Tax=Symbiobacterium terraclitae TaxID=557451 RepID=UPI0035B51F76
MRKDLWVIHLDMDAFFAAVEQRDNPRLRGKPVIVGGSPGSRGVVSTCSYEARRFGVRSAMPSREALRLCPQAIFIRPNHAKYAEVGRQVRAIMRRFTDVIQPLSIDEAFLDVSGQDAVRVARELKEAIRSELKLTGSAGVSYCKFLAKLASDMEKPDGLTVITWERAQELLPTLPVRKLWGVGPASEQALNALGIFTCGDLLAYDPETLRKHFGKRADELVQLARGIDPRPVVPHREAKSIGEENTFPVDQTDREYLAGLLERYADDLARELQRQGLAARTVTVKIKWNVFVEGGARGGDFLQITRGQTLPMPTDDARTIGRAAREIFTRVEWEGRKIRLLGLSVHNLVKRGELVQAYLPI